jgi:hypothetical protein
MDGQRRQVAASRGTPRPRIDSPTYLRITKQIDEAEYRRRMEERRERFGLPPRRPENTVG